MNKFIVKGDVGNSLHMSITQDEVRLLKREKSRKISHWKRSNLAQLFLPLRCAENETKKFTHHELLKPFAIIISNGHSSVIIKNFMLQKIIIFLYKITFFEEIGYKSLPQFNSLAY